MPPRGMKRERSEQGSTRHQGSLREQGSRWTRPGDRGQDGEQGACTERRGRESTSKLSKEDIRRGGAADSEAGGRASRAYGISVRGGARPQICGRSKMTKASSSGARRAPFTQALVGGTDRRQARGARRALPRPTRAPDTVHRTVPWPESDRILDQAERRCTSPRVSPKR